MRNGVLVLLLVVILCIHNTDTIKFEKSRFNVPLRKTDVADPSFLPWSLAGPRLYGEKVPNRLISPRVRRVQRRIVMLHDFFRTKVVPPAANMLSMVSARMSRSFGVSWMAMFLTSGNNLNRHLATFECIQCGCGLNHCTRELSPNETFMAARRPPESLLSAILMVIITVRCNLSVWWQRKLISNHLVAHTEG